MNFNGHKQTLPKRVVCSDVYTQAYLKGVNKERGFFPADAHLACSFEDWPSLSGKLGRGASRISLSDTGVNITWVL